MEPKQIINNELTPFGIEKELTNFNSSKFHIISVPYAPTVSYLKGAENAPYHILKASEQVELYDINYHNEPYLRGISSSKINSLIDIKQIWSKIEKEVLECLNSNKFPVILGGEHSITNGAVNACKKFSKNMCVLQIDAHCDLRKEYLGNPFNHACALRHVFNQDIPIIQIGIRSGTKEEYLLIKNNPDKITTFFANSSTLDINKILNKIKYENIYITIDLDGFDPSVIPHVGTPEPGGPGWYEVLTLLEEVFKNFNVLAADIVELAPNQHSTISDFTAAKLLYKLFCLKDKG